ncbi:MAG: Bcr/CflA family drug resistance efflux transporter, partial [Alphaproteobacteria bacterium]
ATGLVLPTQNAGAHSVHPALAGSAAGLTGFLPMGLSALATVAIGAAMAGSEAPLVAATAGTSLASALALLLLRAPRGSSLRA